MLNSSFLCRSEMSNINFINEIQSDNVITCPSHVYITLLILSIIKVLLYTHSNFTCLYYLVIVFCLSR